MTIAEYIEELKKLPQDLVVVCRDWEYYEGLATLERITPEMMKDGISHDGTLYIVNDTIYGIL